MAFWKKSEDPWDIDPEKRRPPAAETAEDGQPAPGLLEQLRDWNEARKQAREARAPQPIPCPWCGREMEIGYLMGGRGVYWRPGRPGGFFTGLEDYERLDTDGTLLSSYKFAWYCAGCRKLVLDLPEHTSDTEYEEELRGYAAQAENREEER